MTFPKRSSTCFPEDTPSYLKRAHVRVFYRLCDVVYDSHVLPDATWSCFQDVAVGDIRFFLWMAISAATTGLLS